MFPKIALENCYKRGGRGGYALCSGVLWLVMGVGELLVCEVRLGRLG